MLLNLFFFFKSCPFWHLLQLKFVLFLFVSVIITVIMRMSNSGQEGGGKQNKRTDYKLKMHIVAPVRKNKHTAPGTHKLDNAQIHKSTNVFVV